MRQIKIQHNISNRDSESIKKYFNEVSQIPLITIEEEKILSEKIKDGDVIAKNKLVSANLRFVISVAKQYQTGTIPLADVINEGNMGLMIAAERFDHTRGFKFISYAVWWIRQSIIASIDKNSRVVRLPGNRSTTLSKINQFVDLKIKETGEVPSLEDICAHAEITHETYVSIMEASLPHVSLDKPLQEGENSTLADLMESDLFGEPDTNIIKEGRHGRINAMLGLLPSREAQVLRLAFGIGETQPWTLEAISENLGLSRERVRQIKEQSIRRLRYSGNVKKFSEC